MSSSSTMPKSVEAQMGDNDATSSSHERRIQMLEFAAKYKNLPEDFLRLQASSYAEDTYTIDQARPLRESPMVDIIEISVVEAQLVKNYGLLRMDLYCKIRVGHMVSETQTCQNGARNPKWDGVYRFNIKPGIETFHLEIYDEKQFSSDEKIASLDEPLPPEIFNGITVERWFPLSGKLGHNKEGSVLLVISHKKVPMSRSAYSRGGMPPGHPMTVFIPNQPVPMIMGPGVMDGRVPTYMHPESVDQMVPTQPPAPAGSQDPGQPQPPMPASEQDINQLSEMFPAIDKVVIKDILESHGNNKEATIGALLALA